MSDLAPVKNRLVPAFGEVKSAWCVDSGCSFMKFVVRSFILRALPYGVMYLCMLGLKSDGGVRHDCIAVLRALLATLSARSLPGMPTWPGSQQR